MHRPTVSLAALALVFSACRPDYPLCKSDDHCTERGEVCVEGQCRECAADAQCKTGFTCKASACVPKPECDGDAQCMAGAKCKEGKCVAELAAGACKQDVDCTGGKSCVAGMCADKPAPTEVASRTGLEPPPAACELQKVHFGFNEFTLSEVARRELDMAADCIKRRQYTKLSVEGHADERGTAEYNLALGEKRANVVKKYLADLGVDPRGLDTLSWGEEKPAVEGQNEAAFQENRRTEIKPTGK